ncbi:hypothetical protein CC86DRAFT_366907 [Ophiobolus disseminans]|uniref:Uncharacterized protein n=1 Tax=Ophiobolus disseminans TaxID=1469910 RepID=A0A6A7AG57_9PLEO|nr:hypothetical protein CC86DRAFT_366907 [Ophiobolus disseminans]
MPRITPTSLMTLLALVTLLALAYLDVVVGAMLCHRPDYFSWSILRLGLVFHGVSIAFPYSLWVDFRERNWWARKRNSIGRV